MLPEALVMPTTGSPAVLQQAEILRNLATECLSQILMFMG
jgi:hypothetical protein